MASGKLTAANGSSVISGGCAGAVDIETGVDYRFPRHIDFSMLSGSLVDVPGTYAGLLMRFTPAVRSNGGVSPKALGPYIFDAGPFIMPGPGSLEALILNAPAAEITYDFDDVYWTSNLTSQGLYYLTMPEVVAGVAITKPPGAVAFRMSCRNVNLVLAASFPTVVTVNLDYGGFIKATTIMADTWQPARNLRAVIPPGGFPAGVRLVWKISIFGETISCE